MYGDVVGKVMSWVFVVGNNICSGKLRSIHNFQAGVDVLVHDYGHPLGIKNDTTLQWESSPCSMLWAISSWDSVPLRQVWVETTEIVEIRCFDGSLSIPIHWGLGCGCLLVYSFRWLALVFLLLQSTQHAHFNRDGSCQPSTDTRMQTLK